MALNWRSKFIHPQVAAPGGFRSLVTPTYRVSTTLFEDAAEVTDDWDQNRVRYSYGLYGTPTTFELAARIADLEGGGQCFITPGGQAAIALIYLGIARSGGSCASMSGSRSRAISSPISQRDSAPCVHEWMAETRCCRNVLQAPASFARGVTLSALGTGRSYNTDRSVCISETGTAAAR